MLKPEDKEFFFWGLLILIIKKKRVKIFADFCHRPGWKGAERREEGRKEGRRGGGERGGDGCGLGRKRK